MRFQVRADDRAPFARLVGEELAIPGTQAEAREARPCG